MNDRGPPGAPRWVKVFVVVGVIVVLILVVLLLMGGGHGPGRHSGSGGRRAHTPAFHHP